MDYKEMQMDVMLKFAKAILFFLTINTGFMAFIAYQIGRAFGVFE